MPCARRVVAFNSCSLDSGSAPLFAMMRGGKSPKLTERGSKKAVSVAGQTSGGGGAAGGGRNASNGGSSMAGKKRKKKKDKQLPSTSSAAGSGKYTSTVSKETVKALRAPKTEETSSGK